MNKITKINNVRLINDEFVEKKEQDLNVLYNYLKSRDFNYFPNLIERKENYNRYEYIEDYSIDDNQKSQDLIDTLALLHNKTSFNKEVNLDKNKEIYEKLKGYIKHLKDKHNKMIEEFEYFEFPSPSQQVYMYNYSKLIACLGFIDTNIDSWYKLVENKTKERVVMIHGNPNLDHIIKNDRTYLISWNNSRIETPIIDIVTLYHQVWDKVEFSSLLERYLSKCELSESELKLLLINITLPLEINNATTEFERVIEMNKFVNYIYKTEELVRPYYSK